jgi:transcription termination/antitermination protein NusG
VNVIAEYENSTEATPETPESLDDLAADQGAEEGTGPKRKMRWYVVQAYSGFENKVKASLEERIRQHNMQADFGEILIPREQVTETRGTAKRVTSRTFYPGYMFVQMNLTDESWHLVKDTPKVSGFVGGRYPTAVPSSQINLVAQQVAEGAAKPKPRVVFEQGDHVRVIEGAFANFTGTIEEVKPEKQKVRVLVSIFGRATPVELDYAQVEKTV